MPRTRWLRRARMRSRTGVAGSLAFIASAALAAALAGCGLASAPPSGRSPYQSGSTKPPSPPPVPGPTFAKGDMIASPGSLDIVGLEEAQIDAMFDTAVAQAPPMEDKRAICVGMQGTADRNVKDAPARVVRRLGRTLRLPAVPASQCKFDIFPFVAATGANAMLYTVRVSARDARGILTFWALASYGNLGANGAEFRLVRLNGRWNAESTGTMVVS